MADNQKKVDMLLNDDEYFQIFDNIKKEIREAQYKATAIIYKEQLVKG